MRYLSLEQAIEGWALETGGRVTADEAFGWSAENGAPARTSTKREDVKPAAHHPSNTPADRSLAI